VNWSSPGTPPRLAGASLDEVHAIRDDLDIRTAALLAELLSTT
jgi:hypothetical protein